MQERNRQQNKMISFRVIIEAYEQLKLEAEKTNITVSALIKIRVFGNAALTMKSSPPKPPRDIEALRKILGQLGKIGSNLNQIAHHLNQGNNSFADSETIHELLSEVKIMRDALLIAMGVTWDKEGKK